MSLIPVGLDPAPCALFRSLLHTVQAASNEVSSTRVCVELGYSDSTVVIGRQGQICFVKQLPYGLFQLDTDIAEELGISLNEASMLRKELYLQAESKASMSSSLSGGNEPASQQIIMKCVRSFGENLTKEILLCLRYHSVTFRGEFIDGIHICGGGAYETILVDILGQHLSPTPERIRPFAAIEPMSQHVKAVIDQIGYEWAVPVGLAVKLMQKPEEETASGMNMTMDVSSKTMM